MAPFPKSTFSQEFSNLQQSLYTLEESYKKNCLENQDAKNCTSTLTSFEAERIRFQNLDTQIQQKINERRKKIEQSKDSLDEKQRQKKIILNTVMRLDRGDLSAEPRRFDKYQEKKGNYMSVFFYIGFLLFFFNFNL